MADPDKELADNFSRIAAAGVRSGYVRADVTDAAAVRAAVEDEAKKRLTAEQRADDSQQQDQEPEHGHLEAAVHRGKTG